MIFLIESIVLCLIFTLTVPLYGLRDPLAMIDSYPPLSRGRRSLGWFSVNESGARQRLLQPSWYSA